MLNIKNKFNTSLWEHDSFLKTSDVTILGGGIVGINAAINIKEMHPYLDVVVIDRNSFPLGASTRNAGFACFGSVTELLDDLETSSEEDVFELLKDRLEGLKILRNRIGDLDLDYEDAGSYEVFAQDNEKVDHYLAKINYLNDRIEKYTGLTKTFSAQKELKFNFPGLHKVNIFNRHEGKLHPGKMMEKFYSLASNLGVRFLMGHKIQEFQEKAELVYLNGEYFSLTTKKLLVCSNGFTPYLLPELDIKPARNQVLVTQEIPDLEWNTCFHFDKGYVYFRNIGKRILIGGARNIDFDTEITSNFDLTHKIVAHLKEFLNSKLGFSQDLKIEYKWSGIMGIGPQKSPIIKKHSEHVILAVRLGGMGVALGSLVGRKAAEILYS